jgi:CubicO group peptidase (beta-lactamase class C family)
MAWRSGGSSNRRRAGPRRAALPGRVLLPRRAGRSGPGGLRPLAGLLAACVLVLGAPWPAEAQSASRVDRIFARWDRPDSPGCVVGVLRRGRLVATYSYGMADLERREPITSDTVFHIASASKQFVAASVVLAEQQGLLGYDDEVRRHLPELPGRHERITIRHLLHHTSGMPDYIRLMLRSGVRLEDVRTDGPIFELLARQELEFRPGRRFRYSNSGYFLLARIVERAAGRSIGAFAAEHVFRPLGMHRTRFHEDRAEPVQGRALGYQQDGRGLFLPTASLEVDRAGGAAVLTTLEDLARWDRNFFEDRLGGGRLARQMLEVGRLSGGRRLDYAFGLFVRPHRGLRSVSHSGSFLGYHSELVRFTEMGLSVACLCNAGDARATALAHQVAELHLGPWLRRSW